MRVRVCVCAHQIYPANNNASCDTESVGDIKQPTNYCLWLTVDPFMQTETQWLLLYSITAYNVKAAREASCQGWTRFQQLKCFRQGNPERK